MEYTILQVTNLIVSLRFFSFKKYLIKKGIKDNKIKLVKVSKNDLNFIDERPMYDFFKYKENF